MVIVRMIKFGLCNQLFTYSYGRYLAKRYNQKLYIYTPGKMDHGYTYYNGIGKLKLEAEKKINWVQMTSLSRGRNIVHFYFMLKEKLLNGGNRINFNIEKKYGANLAEQGILINYDVSYWNEYLETEKKNYYVRGYFQYKKYVYELKDELCDLLKFSKQEEEKFENIISLMKSTDSVCLHIRRGDYIKNSQFCVCSENYYIEAVKRMRKLVGDITIFVFSDDYTYVKTHRNIFGEKEVYLISEFMNQDATSLDELRLMKYCKYFIISNSSFSWWGQFICDYERKRVIAPSKWYSNDQKSLLYEKEWMLVDC